jgi:hypothetical protein
VAVVRVGEDGDAHDGRVRDTGRFATR